MKTRITELMPPNAPGPRRFAQAILLLLLLAPAGAPAAEIVWTNLAGGNWTAAANWNPNQVPTLSDTAVITNDGTYTITINSSNAVGGLVLGGVSGTQTVALSSTLLLNGAGQVGANGLLNLTGTLTGTNLVTLAGAMTWGNGRIESNAAVVVTASGQITVSSASIITKLLNGSLTNAGTIRFLGNGSLQIAGVLHNQAGGLFDCQTDHDITASGTTALLVNAGIFRKSAGSAVTDCAVPFVNHGTVDVQTGSVNLPGGSVFNDGCAFTGAGKTYLQAGTVTLNGHLTSANLVLSGAALSGVGSLSGSATWEGGSIGAGGVLTVAADGLLRVESSSVVTKSLYGALTNAGTVRFLGNGNLQIAGRLHNLAGGLFDCQTDYDITTSGGTGFILNDGTFRKSAGTVGTDCAVPFVNSGTVDTQVGSVNLPGGSVFNNGCAFTGAGKTVLPSGTIMLNGHCTSTNLVLSGATLTGVGSLSGRATWETGSIGAGGALTVAADGLVRIQSSSVFGKSLSGALTNSGTIQFLGNGDLQITGVFQNLAGGLFDIQTDYGITASGSTGRIINEGTIRKSAGAATTCAVLFANNGTGTVATGPGLVFSLTGGSALNAGCSFTGAGRTRLPALTTNTLTGTINSENLELSGGRLVGAGSVSGSFFWTAGTIDAGLSFYVTTNGLLSISSGSVYTKNLNGYVTNAGTVAWAGNGNLSVAGVIHNLAGGLFDVQSDYDIVSASPAAVIINDGTFRKSVGALATTCAIPFANNGTVDILTGDFYLPGGSALNGGSRFIGAGKTHMNAGTNSIDGTIYSENLILDGATLTGAGNVTGSFIWSAGTISAGLSFYVTTNGVLSISSSSVLSKHLNGTVTNAGTVNFLGDGNLVLAGALHNLPGSLFDIRTDYDLTRNSPSAVVVNEGTFRKTVATGTTSIAIPFYNSGTAEVGTGALSFASNYNHSATAVISLAGGTFQTAGAMLLEGGRLIGHGTLKPGSAQLAKLTSATIVAPATNGVLTVQGNFAQTLAGTLEFELGGTAPGTNHSRLNITGDATFNGTIGVTLADGYLPNPGDSFNVMTFKSCTGDFACFNGFLFLGQNRRVLTQYSPTNLTLVAVSLPDPTNVVPRVTADYPTAIVCWPAEFTGYGLAFATNLATPQWTVLPGVTNRYVDTPMMPEKYFRLWKP